MNNLENMKKVKILVAHHKQGLIIETDTYLPIQVGKDCSNYNLGIVGDNTGENISSKNPLYCEMTAIYWGWKNVQADYMGLCHYRRYFSFASKPLSEVLIDRCRFFINRIMGNIRHPGNFQHYINQRKISNEAEFEKEAQTFSNQLVNILEKKDYDFIIPTPYELSCRNVEQHFIEIGRDHIKLLKEIVKETTPSFSTYFNAALNSDKLYAANMFIARANIFNEYCSLIFPILEEHIFRTISNGWCTDPLKEKCYYRISGYLAEILTSAFVYKMKAERKKILFVHSMFYNSQM